MFSCIILITYKTKTVVPPSGRDRTTNAISVSREPSRKRIRDVVARCSLLYYEASHASFSISHITRSMLKAR
ncbi:hypothetical protein PUN28_002844 [Cardiocondyla obscurior]|uniref:Uncharacterized protein n=1 Tax=Cardiocondyla obscurior TaxID=286306 RepID=A0AAW2GWJ9_9HYME